MVPSNRVATQPNFYKSDRFALLRTPLRWLRADSIPCLCWRTRGCHGSCRLSFRINHRASLINSDRRIVHSVIQYWIAHASPWSSNPGPCESSVALRIPYSSYGFSNLWDLSLETKTYHSGRAGEKHQKYSKITCTAYTMQMICELWCGHLAKQRYFIALLLKQKLRIWCHFWCIGIISYISYTPWKLNGTSLKD